MFISPRVSGNLVLIGSCGGTFYALDRETGDPVWAYDTQIDGARAQFHGEVLIVDSNVVVGTDRTDTAYIYSFEISTGEVAWKLPFARGIESDLLPIDERRLVTMTGSGIPISIRVSDGAIDWMIDEVGNEGHEGSHMMSPAVAGTQAFFAYHDDTIRAVDTSTGSVVWSQRLPASINTSLAVVGDSLYVGMNNNELYRLDTVTGEITSTARLPGLPHGTIIPTAKNLLVLSGQNPGHLVSISHDLETVRWSARTEKTWMSFRPLVMDGTVVAGDSGGNLCAYDLRDGTAAWCHSVEGSPRGLWHADGVLYVGTLQGMVYAYRIDESAVVE